MPTPRWVFLLKKQAELGHRVSRVCWVACRLIAGGIDWWGFSSQQKRQPKTRQQVNDVEKDQFPGSRTHGWVAEMAQTRTLQGCGTICAWSAGRERRRVYQACDSIVPSRVRWLDMAKSGRMRRALEASPCPGRRIGQWAM